MVADRHVNRCARVRRRGCGPLAAPGSAGDRRPPPLVGGGTGAATSVLHIAQVTAYFNFVNRMALGLGVKMDASLDGYKH